MEITRISSKGQIVIPQKIRENMNIHEGTPFIVVTQNDIICLKKIEIPKPKTWKEAVKPFRESARKSNFTQEDLQRIIIETRKK